jgi:hypothetical protein
MMPPAVKPATAAAGSPGYHGPGRKPVRKISEYGATTKVAFVEGDMTRASAGLTLDHYAVTAIA